MRRWLTQSQYEVYSKSSDIPEAGCNVFAFRMRELKLTTEELTPCFALRNPMPCTESFCPQPNLLFVQARCFASARKDWHRVFDSPNDTPNS